MLRFRKCWRRKKEGRGGRREEEEGRMRRKEGREGRVDEEEGWRRRKEQRGGRSDEESEKMKKWLEDASLTTTVLLWYISRYYLIFRRGL